MARPPSIKLTNNRDDSSGHSNDEKRQWMQVDEQGDPEDTNQSRLREHNGKRGYSNQGKRRDEHAWRSFFGKRKNDK